MRTRRDAIIRNLHRLGCPQSAIADGFGLTRERVGQIAASWDRSHRERRWRNQCPHHKIVLAYCRDCKRVAA